MTGRAVVVAALVLAPPVSAQVTQAPDTGRVAPEAIERRDMMMRADTVVTPQRAPERAMDAELRVALFELTNERPLSALHRLERVRATPAATGPARTELLFLISQAQYQLGMGDAFRATAQELMTGGQRFAGVLRVQLMLDAYRRGDYTAARQLAEAVGPAGDRALTGLLVGLSRYQAGDYAGARESFSGSRQAGGSYAPFAQYMEALASMNGDTAQAGQGVGALRALADASQGEFAHQVRLTAAQLAYGAGQYDVAHQLATAIPAESGLGAEALLTSAWAQYRAGQVDGAADTFRAFAARFPHLPQREEARVMLGQILLERGRNDEAATLFRNVADSIGREIATLQSGATAAMSEAARALVSARAAGILFVRDPLSGKTLALPDGAGAEPAVMLAAYGGSAPAAPRVPPPELVSLADIDARVDSIAPNITPGARRALYVSRGGQSVGAYTEQMQQLLAADVRAAIAQARLNEAVDAMRTRARQLEQIRIMVGENNQDLDRLATRLATTQDSVARVSALLDATSQRVREMIQFNIDETSRLAQANAVALDSARYAIGVAGAEEATEIVQLETEVTASYRQLAQIVATTLEGAIARHPAFLSRDSARVRLDRIRGLMAETRAALASADEAAASELAQAQALEAQRTASARSALASAEAARGAAEARLLTLVDGEMRARGDALLATLSRNIEAAEFGAASAAFFKATEGDRVVSPEPTPEGTQGTGGQSSGSQGNSGAPAAPGSTPRR